ncbi:MAG: cation diffusion facilitator family transporter [Bacteroidota bacterium]|nr:cation diffusion facilitator family transporter [Bacteroidota bacterium]
MSDQKKIDEKKRVALVSVFAAIFITATKLIVGLETNSLGILSEAAHSGLDFIAALITYFAVRISDKPPDEKHHYGHGKVENITAFIETLLLFITCAWIIWEAVQRLVFRTPHVEVSPWGFVVIGVAIIIDFSRSRALSRVAKKYHSQALEADALHFSSDIWTSLVVIVGLIFVSIDYVWVDSVAAIAVAFLVLFVSYRLGKRTIDALMDRVPDGIYEDIQAIIERVNGVERVVHTRLRTSGGKLFVDTTVAIRRTTTFQEAHYIMDNIEKSVHEIRPDADVVVHAEPFECVDESLADKIRMIVVGKGLRVPHNLEVHHKDGKYHIDFDIEHQKGKSFVEAHNLTSEIENDIREKMPSVEIVTIHMEESEIDENEVSQQVEIETPLHREIRDFIMNDVRIIKCSDLHLLMIGDKYNLSLTCLIDKATRLDEVHQIINELETKLYNQFKVLRRITVHAEPV